MSRVSIRGHGGIEGEHAFWRRASHIETELLSLSKQTDTALDDLFDMR